MIDFLKRYKKQVTQFVLIGLIVIPLLIHMAFKIPAVSSFFVSVWSAGDVLGFYGVLLGAAATVGGVFLTIQYTQQNYNQDIINRSLPYITLTAMKRNRFAPDNVQENNTFESVGCYYFVIEKQKVTVVSELNQRQKKLMARNGFYEKELASGIVATVSTNLLCQPIEVSNVGNGAATVFSVGLYIPPYSKDNNPKCFSLARSLRTDEKIQIVIYNENNDDSNVGNYDLCISYYDIFGNQYEQLFKYSIFKDENGAFGSKLEMKGTQKRITNQA